MGKKSNLKAMLANYQERQRKSQLQNAREAAKKKDVVSKMRDGRGRGKGSSSAKAKGKRMESQRQHSSVTPVSSTDTILLIGEGNFSFTRALLASDHPSLAYLPPSNIVASTFDSEETCYTKYPDARDIVRDLREEGATVLFGVDARRLNAHREVKKRKWQRVIWNFPHAGKGISDQDHNILSNQILILDFLKSVAPLLEDGSVPTFVSASRKKRKPSGEGDSEGSEAEDQNAENEVSQPQRASGIKERGTVLITLRNKVPYTLWDLPRLAKKPPPPHPSSCSPSAPQPRYVQLRSFAFQRSDWKGYEHRMTKGWVEGLGTGSNRTTESQERAEERTWEFYLAD